MSSAADMLINVERADPGLHELRILIARRQRRTAVSMELGTTRWASPPPGMSVRAAIVIWLLTSFALALLLFSLGYFR